MLKTLSLCSGVGGLDQAVELVTPTQLVAYADPDPDASRVMAHHYPGVPNLGDITVTEWVRLLGLGINLLTAGYPCQPFSLNGSRKGSNDERHLYPFISEAIRVLRPELVFLENVAGHRSKGFGEVLADLSESGYRVAWTSVRASDVGAPHRRDRVFILASNSEVVGCNPVCNIPVGAGTQQSMSVRDHLSPFNWQIYTSAVRQWARLRGGVVPHPVAAGARGGFRVAAEFGEWVMGYPDGWISEVPGITVQTAAKLYGNGVVPHQGARAFAHLVDVLGVGA